MERQDGQLKNAITMIIYSSSMAFCREWGWQLLKMFFWVWTTHMDMSIKINVLGLTNTGKLGFELIFHD